MKALDLRELQIQLFKKKAAPVYFLVAEEPFLLKEALATFKSEILADGAKDFNYDSFSASEDKVDKLRDTAETLPMMSQQRLVLFKEAQLLKEKDWEFLFPLLDNPVESTCLVFIATKVDKRKKYYKKLSSSAQFVELKKPYDNQLTPWIEYIGAKFGLKLSSDAINLIRQFVGSNLLEVYNEMAKLKEFLGERTQVEGEDVLKVVSRSRIDSVFDLAKAIGRGDRASALVNLAQLLESGQNEVGALALIARHFRILSQIKEENRAGLSGQRLSSKLGIPHFFLQEYTSQAHFWTERKLETTVLALRETDKALKSSPLSSHIWLENFILRICRTESLSS